MLSGAVHGQDSGVIKSIGPESGISRASEFIQINTESAPCPLGAADTRDTKELRTAVPQGPTMKAAQLDRLLKENEAFANAVLEFQRQGKVAEAAEYQKRLQKNLLLLLDSLDSAKDTAS